MSNTCLKHCQQLLILFEIQASLYNNKRITFPRDDVDKDGQPELITGKRYYAHSGNDAGAHDDMTIQYYNWVAETGTWTKHIISTAPAGEGPGIGLQIRVHDLDGDGWKDIVVPGKSGTHILWNEGK